MHSSILTSQKVPAIQFNRNAGFNCWKKKKKKTVNILWYIVLKTNYMNTLLVAAKKWILKNSMGHWEWLIRYRKWIIIPVCFGWKHKADQQQTHKATIRFFSHFALSLFNTFAVSVSTRGGCYKVWNAKMIMGLWITLTVHVITEYCLCCSCNSTKDRACFVTSVSSLKTRQERVFEVSAGTLALEFLF